jgi:uncharacterized membrane protein
VRYAYESLGVSSNTAIFLLLATLVGSFFNIPIAELAPERATHARTSRQYLRIDIRRASFARKTASALGRNKADFYSG